MTAPSLSSPRLLLVIAYLGFISLGLPDTVIGVAWPSVRDTFGRQQSSVAVIFIGVGLSYFLSSFFTGRLLKMVGIGWLLAGSSLLVAASAAGYALTPWWALFAVCATFHGLGSGAIDAGLNHYVAHHFSARHMNWLHACYSLGATFGPLIMTAVLAGGNSWRAGYGTVAAILCGLALLFGLTRRKWDANEESVDEEKPAEVSMAATLRDPTVRLQIALFFFYTGLEATVGQWSFTLLTEGRNVPQEKAGVAVTIYWASIGVGRILFGWVVDRIGVDRLVRGSTALAAAGTVLLASSASVWLSTVALALTGLGLAAIFPCLMTRTPQRLPPGMAAHAIGFQVSAAMLGVAALPSATGVCAERFGLASIASAAVLMAAAVWLLHESLLRMGRRRAR